MQPPPAATTSHLLLEHLSCCMGFQQHVTSLTLGSKGAGLERLEAAQAELTLDLLVLIPLSLASLSCRQC